MELNDAIEPRWHLPSALSPEAHAEWGLYKIPEYMCLHEILPAGQGQNRDKLKKDIKEYHILAFDKEKKLRVFLEYTRAMDSNEDWAAKKESEKNDRYSAHLGFINHLSRRAAGKPRKPTSQWECEASFTLTNLSPD